MNTLKIILKIIVLLICTPLLIGGIALLCWEEYIGGIIMEITGIVPIIFVILSFRKKLEPKLKQMECPICKCKINWLNTPLAGKLQSGEKLYSACFRKISRIIRIQILMFWKLLE